MSAKTMATKQISTRRKYRVNRVNTFAEICIHFVVGGFAIACVIPFIFIIIIALSSAESLRQVGYSFFPVEMTLTSFRAAFDMGGTLARSFFNSVYITVVGTILSLFITVMYAYGLYRRDYPLRHFFTFFVFFTMIFGGGLVPTVVVVRNLLGIANTYWAMIVPLLMAPFNVIIMRTFFKTSVPESLIECASLDGSGEFRTLFTIVIPLAKPGIATVALLTAINYWNDWFQAMLYIRNSDLFPLQYLLMEMQQNIEFLRRNIAMIGAIDVSLADLPSAGLRMALAVIIVLPIAFAYPFFQRFIISGLTVGAIKE